MAYAPNELQKAVFLALSANSGLTTLLGGAKIYDFTPDGTAYPYITFNGGDAVDRGSDDSDGWLHTLELHTWYRGRGRKGVLAIQELIDGILHNQEIAISGFTNLSFRRDFQTVLVEPDNITYHGVQRFRILTGE